MLSHQMSLASKWALGAAGVIWAGRRSGGGGGGDGAPPSHSVVYCQSKTHLRVVTFRGVMRIETSVVRGYSAP